MLFSLYVFSLMVALSLDVSMVFLSWGRMIGVLRRFDVKGTVHWKIKTPASSATHHQQHNHQQHLQQ